MQIAKMFASLGFKVDSTGLNDFKDGLKDIKKELSSVSNYTQTASSSLKNLKNDAKKFREEMKKAKTATGKIQGVNAGTKTSTTIKQLNDEFNKIITRRRDVTNAIGKINASVTAGSPLWDRYRESVVRARRALHNINGEVRNLKANSRIHVTGGVTGGGGRGIGRGSNTGIGGAIGAGLGIGGVANFLKSGFIPATALAGASASLGYGSKMAVDAGRDQTRMETMLLMTAKSSGEFGRTLEYVNKEAMRLGLSSTELGKSFAQINMSAQGLSQEEKETMFTGFSEFMMSMGTSRDDQKGIFRAFNQMFSSNRILQEEINQLSERGIPATLVQDAAMKAYGLDSRAKVKKLQEDGQLDPTKVLPIMAEMVQKMARDSGAYDKMMNSSIVKQGQFEESLRQLSKQIMDSGVDEALGRMFGKLTELVEVLSEAVDGMKGVVEILKQLKETTDEATGGNTFLALATALVLFRFKHVGKAVRGIITALRTKTGVVKSLGGLFTGTFGKALGKIIGRFFVWTAVISAVFKGLSMVGKAVNRRDSGELTWIDIVLFKLEELAAWFDYASSVAELFFARVTAFAKNPIKFALEIDAPWVDAVGDTIGTAATIANPNPFSIPAKVGAFKDLMEKLSLPKFQFKPENQLSNDSRWAGKGVPNVFLIDQGVNVRVRGVSGGDTP